MAFNTYPCNPWPISTEQLNKGNNDDLNTRVAALESEVSNLNDTKANQITIAPFFDPEASYEVGDLVYYNGLTYRCTNDHEGEWDADDFAATTIAGELDTLKSGLNNVKTTQDQANYGSATDISTATFVSPFVATTDGYIRVKGTGTVYLNRSDDSSNVTLADMVDVILYSIFIKKGARVYVTGFAEVKFLALT